MTTIKRTLSFCRCGQSYAMAPGTIMRCIDCGNLVVAGSKSALYKVSMILFWIFASFIGIGGFVLLVRLVK